MSLYNDDVKALAGSLSGFPPLTNAHSTLTVDNPLCGDRVTIHSCYDSEGCCEEPQLLAVHCEVRGCLLCQATAAIVMNGVKQAPLNLEQIDQLTACFDGMMKAEQQVEWPAHWQAMQLFAPLSAHKSRYSCVRLVFEGLSSALQGATP